MKSVMLAIQPYWVFLIIAKKMGWDIGKEKTIEVRKSFPKDEDWNRKSEIYCSKDKKSFNLIPKEYQPLMKRFLGKVVGRFYCPTYMDGGSCLFLKQSCLSIEEFFEYNNGNRIYGWRIADLKVYDKPRELSDFKVECPTKNQINGDCLLCKYASFSHYGNRPKCNAYLTRPPQSWCYVEDLESVSR